MEVIIILSNITVIILTKDEEKNIGRCIRSVKRIAERIVVVDSGSTDDTVSIAKSLGAEVFLHPFKHYADQFNWAIDNVGIETTWVYRIDADEYITTKLADEIILKCKKHENDDVTAFLMKHKVYFLGKCLMHGGVYPFVKITVFKPRYARFEDIAMGGHIVPTKGRCLKFENNCIHNDLKTLSELIDKHNSYATREMMDYFNEISQETQLNLYREARLTRTIRNKIYYHLPPFFRAKLYYYYRYYAKLGFLDGKEGKIYAFLQAYWYRFLVDAKIYEKESSK